MVLLVKGLRMGLGFASEAIHAARGSKDAPAGPPPGAQAPEGYYADDGSYVQNGYRREDGAWIPNYYYGEDGSWIPNTTHAPASTEYTETHSEAAADQLIRNGEAERFADDNGPPNEKALYDSSVGHREALDQDEAVWRLDEMSQSLNPPTYDDTMAHDEALNASAEESEESRFIRSEQKRENMVRELVNMAGPMPSNPQRLSTSVIIPQRRPHKRDRGFVRAYAPVLAEAGINQETFIQFIEDLEAANTANKFIEVVYVAAGIVGCVPGVATMVTSVVVQVAAGIAMELQKRGRQNSFIDRVNQELFMPRGLICMVASFKQQLPGQSPTSVYKKDKLGLNEAAAKFNPDNYDEEHKMKWTDKIRVQSAKTTEFELPEAAPLVYPNLEQAAQQVATAEDGQKGQVAALTEKMSRAGEWTQDYFDRRAHAKLEQENPGTALAVSADQRAPMKSRFNDPNHPSNAGSLIALLSGGLIPVPGIDKMLAYKRDNIGVTRLIRGKTNDAEQYGMWMPKARLIKSLQKDVLYLLVMNLPTEEEIAESRAQVEQLHQQAQQAEYREPEAPMEQPVPETGLPPASYMGQI